MAVERPKLLDKAKAAPRDDRTRVGASDDELDLVFAYASGEVSHAQVQAAVGKTKNVSSWMGRAILAGIRAGRIVRVNPNAAA